MHNRCTPRQRRVLALRMQHNASKYVLELRDGRLSAGRLTCLDAVLQGGLEPDGEVMLAAHLVLLLPELHLLPVGGHGLPMGPGHGDKYRFCYKLVPFLRRTFLRIFCVFLSILSAFGPKGCIQFMHLGTHFCASATHFCALKSIMLHPQCQDPPLPRCASVVHSRCPLPRSMSHVHPSCILAFCIP